MVWGYKAGTTFSRSQNKAAKLVLDKPLYSSATDGLNQLGWLNLKQGRYFHRCLYVYNVPVNSKTAHHPPPPGQPPGI